MIGSAVQKRQWSGGCGSEYIHVCRDAKWSKNVQVIIQSSENDAPK